MSFKFVVGDSYDDSVVLLDVLSGEHGYTRRERVLIYAVAAGVGLSGIAAGVGGWREDPALGGLMMLIAIGMALLFWHQASCRTTFSRDAIEHRGPLKRWSLRAGDVQRFELASTRGGWLLVLNAIDGKQRTIELTSSMEAALSTLYPGFFGQVVFSKVVGMIAYSLLAVAIVAFVVLVVAIN